MKKIKKRKDKNMATEDKRINKTKTLQNILDWGNRSIGYSINTTKLNQAMEKSDWEEKLEKMAEYCKVEIVYN
ncbi:MAG: hypothetical protein WC606_04015 [Candidatus Absconditabacterales bacterium]|jgi:hypothetical protein